VKTKFVLGSCILCIVGGFGLIFEFDECSVTQIESPAIGCSVLSSPQLPNDIAKIENCIQYAVESGVTDPVNIATTCYPDGLLFVEDFINALIHGEWGQAHPSLVPALQKQLVFLHYFADGGR